MTIHKFFENSFTIAVTLSHVPVRNPIMPINKMKTFLYNSQVVGRLFSEYSTTSSIRGGNIKAKDEEQNAPMKEMSRTMCGTTSATATVIKLG